MTVTANGFSSTTIHSSCASKPNINQQSMDWAYAPPRYFLKNHLCYQPNDFPSCPDVTPSSPDSPTLAIDLTPLVYMTNVVTQRELFVVDHLWENVVLRSFSELTARRRVATSSYGNQGRNALRLFHSDEKVCGGYIVFDCTPFIDSLDRSYPS